MILHLEFWPTLAFVVVMSSWFAFAVVFLVFLRKKPPSPPDSKREPTSIVGIALQGAGYALVWSVHRRPFTPIAPWGKLFEIAVAVVTIVLAIGSVWFISA